MKINYLLIPLLVVLVAVTGSFFTSQGIESGWYDQIVKPSWTPAGSLIGAVWTTIFILFAAAVLIFWNWARRDNLFWVIIAGFVLNGFLNVFWSYLFFYEGMIAAAFFEAIVLSLSVAVLIYLTLPKVKITAYLLVPYLLWVSFASYLNFIILTLN